MSPFARVIWGLVVAALFVPTAIGQDDDDSPFEDDEPQVTETAEWDRLIYVPFEKLSDVFKNQDASAVIPYAEYMRLLEAYLEKQSPQEDGPQAVITKSSFTGTVEKDIVRLQATLNIRVLRKEGWAKLPLLFGDATVGELTTEADDRVLLRGTGKGSYELLLQGAGDVSVQLQLMVPIQTSADSRSFALRCPAVGISELELTIPEPDQAVSISPVQVLFPTDDEEAEQTVVRASLGATDHFRVAWNPRAGTKPVMDLLASAVNESTVRVEPGLIQTTTQLNYEVLRGELTEVTVLVPADARVIDVSSGNGRIGRWTTDTVDDTHQRISVELLTPAKDKFHLEVQTERVPDAEAFHLLGASDEGSLHGIHADGVVRETGRIQLSTDASLIATVKSQSGVKRVDAGEDAASGQQAWEFRGRTGRLEIQTKPVEPRLLVDQIARVVFDDDELRLSTRLTYTIERAGVFQLELSYPKDLVIDVVRADGMSEFNSDTSEGTLRLSLARKRQGKINVDIVGHQPFDAAAENAEVSIPSITPLNVERENGRVLVFAPQFLDVITTDDGQNGLFPATDVPNQKSGRAPLVSSWKYTQRPFSLTVKTSPRPAQMTSQVATTATIDPAYVTVRSLLSFDIQNAGIDTFRVAVPEDIDHVNFSAVGPYKIQQQEKATEAEDGWVTWKLVLQDEVTGRVVLSSDWKIPVDTIEPADDERQLEIRPIRVLPPFTDDQQEKRRVSVTPTKGEIRLVRDDSLSITAEASGTSAEKVDVRELVMLPQEGDLAFRYFSQPAAVTVGIREHEIHEVVQTVVSKAAFEIVTDRQQLASYRCRLKIASSERQRLRIDLPVGAELQTPLLGSRRTTFEAAEDVEVADGWTAYYINVSREETSDRAFLLSFQFRCPITGSEVYPYDGRGGRQILRLPIIGDGSGGTVVQETRTAVWCPKFISLVGEPDGWTITGRQVWNFWNPLASPTADTTAKELDNWVGRNPGAADFAQQGSVTVYRALGRRNDIEVVWWSRPFLVAVVCGSLLFVGIILRRTSWENRITLTVIVGLVVALWSLEDHSEAMQFLSAGSLGIAAVAVIWVVSAVLPGRRHKAASGSPPAPPGGSPAVAAVSPSPEVTKTMDDLMGGGKS